MLVSDVVYRNPTTTSLVSSTTETTIATYTIPGKQLDTNRLFRLRIYGALFNNTGGANGVTFRAKFNATTYITDATLNAVGSSAANFTSCFIEYMILAAGTTTDQNHFYSNTSASTPLGTAAASRSSTVGGNVGTVDTSSDRVVLMTAQLSASSANLSWTTSNVVGEYF